MASPAVKQDYSDRSPAMRAAWTPARRAHIANSMRTLWARRKADGYHSPLFRGGRGAARLRRFIKDEDRIKEELKKTACEACGQPFGDARKRGPGTFRAWDHDHKTGAYRGAICQICNLTLGQSRESVDRLRRLADYLERFRAETE